jgi:Family of unknown function (DUF5989)
LPLSSAEWEKTFLICGASRRPQLAGWSEIRRDPLPKASAVRGASMSFLFELWKFMRVRKKYWLMPIMFVMIIFGGLVVLTKGSVIAPMIYTLF